VSARDVDHQGRAHRGADPCRGRDRLGVHVGWLHPGLVGRSSSRFAPTALVFEMVATASATSNGERWFFRLSPATWHHQLVCRCTTRPPFTDMLVDSRDQFVSVYALAYRICGEGAGDRSAADGGEVVSVFVGLSGCLFAEVCPACGGTAVAGGEHIRLERCPHLQRAQADEFGVLLALRLRQAGEYRVGGSALIADDGAGDGAWIGEFVFGTSLGRGASGKVDSGGRAACRGRAQRRRGRLALFRGRRVTGNTGGNMGERAVRHRHIDAVRCLLRARSAVPARIISPSTTRGPMWAFQLSSPQADSKAAVCR
jgi:hypothetical protein